jgi:uncharacterized protein
MQQRVMIPKFKQGDFGGGIEAGLFEVDRKLRGAQPAPYPTRRPVSPYESQLVRDSVTGALVPANGAAPAQLAGITRSPSPGSSGGDFLTSVNGLFTMAVGGAGSILGFLFLGRFMRKCPKCRSDTILLDELSDNAHLNEVQKFEESIGSVDYKVYVCPGCDFTRTVASAKWFSGYSCCRGCQARTMKSTSTTLTYATEDHGGTVQVNESCVRCPYTGEFTRSTPRKTRSSSSSSSSSFSGGRSRGGGGGSSW